MLQNFTTKRFIIVVIVVTCGWVNGCATLPQAQTTSTSVAESPATGGFLAKTAEAITAQRGHNSTSSFLLLPDARESLDIRLAMMENASRTLDIQYFIWKGDVAGSLAWEALASAADRGVRVRVLVDDLFMASQGTQDTGLAAVSAHPNIELRIFNPGKYRSGVAGIAGNFLTRFDEFNRRMHNKLMIADGRFALVGGRNVGDEYFGLHQKYNFVDLDLLVAGEGVTQATRGFDEFWNHESAYPAASLAEAREQDFQKLREENDAILDEHQNLLVSYIDAEEARRKQFSMLAERMSHGSSTYLQDPAEDTQDADLNIYNILASDESEAVKQMHMVTAYLIPRGNMLEQVKSDIDNGMEVYVLTNSMASIDHTSAASQYNKFRKDILATGVRLYEFRHQPSEALRSMADVAPVRSDFIGLHSKAGVDNTGHCFVGSLNLDPRAIDINTENGMLVESEALCDQVRELIIEQMLPDNAWEVTLDADGKLQWTSSEGTVHQQPARSTGQRLGGALFQLLPLQNQL